MKTFQPIIYLAVLLVFALSGIVLAQQDKEGYMDYPLFSRMQGYYIFSCEEKEFDAEKFIDPATQKEVTIEGRKGYTYYTLEDEFKGKYSILQASRNYTNAITRIGGTFWVIDPKDPYRTCMKLVKDNKEIWAKLEIVNEADDHYLRNLL